MSTKEFSKYGIKYNDVDDSDERLEYEASQSEKKVSKYVIIDEDGNVLDAEKLGLTDELLDKHIDALKRGETPQEIRDLGIGELEYIGYSINDIEEEEVEESAIDSVLEGIDGFSEKDLDGLNTSKSKQL